VVKHTGEDLFELRNKLKCYRGNPVKGLTSQIRYHSAALTEPMAHSQEQKKQAKQPTILYGASM
jgi:hypothetical protein